MTKWIFATLVLANVGGWMWTRWYMEAPPAGEVPRPSVHAEKMRLLGEPGVQLKLRPLPPAPPPAAQVAAKAPPACYRAGPYSELESAVTAGKRLEERGIASMRREETSRTITGYRVFLPPFPSKQAAEARRKEIVHLGFHDNALVQENGRYEISLGLFSVETNATDHLKKLVAKGIQAKLEPLHQARAAYWLELNGDNLFETLKDFDWGARGVTLAEYPCPPPAADAAAEPAQP